MLGRPGLNRTTIIYGLAHFGKSLFWYSSELLFAYYLTEISHIPAIYMGAILAAGFVCGAAADLIVAKLLVSQLSNSFRAARLQALGAGISSVMIVLLFLGAFVPDVYKIAYAICVGLGFRIGYALYDLPQNALLSLATRNNDSRSRVSSVRLFFSGAASLIVAGSIGPLLTANLPLPIAWRFLSLAIFLACIALLTAFGLRRELLALERFQQDDRRPEVSHAKVASELPHGLWVIIGMSFIISATVSCFGKVEPYYATYVLKSAFLGGLIMTAAATGTAISQPVWTWLALRTTRYDLILVASALLIVSGLVFWGLGRDPLGGIICAFGFGAASGGLGMTLWAAFGDSVASRDKRAVGMSYGVLTATIKIALAIGGLTLGAGLSHFDYRGAEASALIALMCAPALIGTAMVVMTVLASKYLYKKSSL